jgi:FtsZ-binding cell division protein ZapB
MRGSDPKADDGPVRLGDRLIEAGLITRGELDSTLDLLRENGLSNRRLGRTLVDLGFLSDRELMKVLATHFGMSVAPFPVSEAEPAAIKQVPVEFARQHRLLACRLASGSLSVAVAGPIGPEVITELRRMTGHSVQVYLASDRDIEAGLAKFYPEPGAEPAKPITTRNGGFSVLADAVKPAAATAPVHAEKAASLEKPAAMDKPAPLGKPATVETPRPVEQRTPASAIMSETLKVNEAPGAALAVAASPPERGSDLQKRAQHCAAQTRQLATALQRITEDSEQFCVEIGTLQREWETLRQDNARLQQEVDRARDDVSRLRKEFDRVREEKEQVLAAVAKFAEETLGKHQARS